MKMHGIWIALLSLLLGTPILLAVSECPGGIVRNHACTPFRAGIIKLNAELDKTKPLAPADFGGVVASQDMIVTSPYKGWLAGYSMKKGKYIWWSDIGSEVASPLSSYGSWVLASTRAGKLHKLESSTGKTLWATELGKNADRRITIHGNFIFLQSSGNQLFALDSETGRKLWLYDGGLAEELTIRNGAQPVFFEKKVFMGTSGGDVHILDPDSGQLLRRISPKGKGSFRFRDVMGEMFVVDGQLTFCRYDGLVTKVSYTGPVDRVVWESRQPGLSTCHFRENILFAGAISGQIIALDLNVGKLLWRQDLGETVLSFTSGEQILYLVGSQGQIAALDPGKGSIYWADHLYASMSPDPLQFGDRLYFSTGLRTLYSYKVK